MTNCILIRYGELFLKGANKPFFENRLIRNIKAVLQDFDFDFSFSQARFFVENYKSQDEAEILERLKRVFGIHSMSICYKLTTDIEAVADFLCQNFKKAGKFRVTVNRADKRLKQNSMQIASFLGSRLFVEGQGKLQVDLENFDHEIIVDIRENGFTYVFFDRILGAGGLPVGCSGRGLLLLSGGIDSPVAGYMMAKRGMSISALHFHSFPYTSMQAKEKVVELAKIVDRYSPKLRLFNVEFTKIQEAIRDNCPIEFMIAIMRRVMMRIACIVAKKRGFDALITGESLGQVASQTVESLTSTTDAANVLTLRPLIGFDKSQIIELAQDMGSYDISILPYDDCCTVFLPQNPIIRPRLDIVRQMEERIKDLDVLIAEAVAGIEVCK